MLDFIEAVNKVRAANPDVGTLWVLIVAPTYKECDAIRSKFPAGAGDALLAQNICIEFITYEDVTKVLGRTALCCVVDDFETLDYDTIPASLLHAIFRSLHTTATTLEVSKFELIVNM